jgi:hypothetical protein
LALTLKGSRANSENSRECAQKRAAISASSKSPLDGPHSDDDPKRVSANYREAGAHRPVFLNDSPMPATCERQLDELVKAWIG